MSKNSEILNNWNKDISNYPHLKFDEAVCLYKQGKRNEVICGTLYKIYDFVSKDVLKKINNSSYDLEDIISSVTVAWIEVLDEGILEKVIKIDDYL